jgi:hypothetical protein
VGYIDAIQKINQQKEVSNLKWQAKAVGLLVAMRQRFMQ